jgi:hypothetical protein
LVSVRGRTYLSLPRELQRLRAAIHAVT